MAYAGRMRASPGYGAGERTCCPLPARLGSSLRSHCRAITIAITLGQTLMSFRETSLGIADQPAHSVAVRRPRSASPARPTIALFTLAVFTDDASTSHSLEYQSLNKDRLSPPFHSLLLILLHPPINTLLDSQNGVTRRRNAHGIRMGLRPRT